MKKYLLSFGGRCHINSGNTRLRGFNGEENNPLALCGYEGLDSMIVDKPETDICKKCLKKEAANE